MKIQIIVEVDEDNEHADPAHSMGVTNECYEWLAGATGEPAPLGELGEVTDVKRIA